MRSIIAASDVYHLTPPPARQSPTGWTAMQYVADEGKRCVLLAYRLAKSPPQQTFKLRGLRHGEQYRVTQDGQAKGQLSGQELAGTGLTLDVPKEWQAVVIEFEAMP